VRRPRDAAAVALRPVRPDDRDRLLAWRNEPSTRRWFLNPGRVRRADHARWFASRLTDGACRMYVAERDGVAVGQVRIERTRRGAEVSFSVAPPARGQGIGPLMLARAARRAARDLGASRLFAYVVPSNVPSAIAFLKAGFRFTRVRRREGTDVYEFEIGTA
jgi:RimJ/RimL family protein N-acetyltransferase